MTIWFSSDLHLGHENIIKFCDRPFQTVYEMDEQLRDLHNTYVKPQDHWYCLGDVTLHRGGRPEQERFITEMRRWHGHKRLILGNHDHFPTKVYLEAGFEKIYATWRGIDNLILSHIPVHPKSLAGTANIHGHTHNNQDGAFPPVKFTRESGEVIIRPYINVCVEHTNYHPISLEEVNERVRTAIQLERDKDELDKPQR